MTMLKNAHHSMGFLEAVAHAGLEVDLATSAVREKEIISGWSWDLGGDVRSFFHPGQDENYRALTYRASRDSVGLRVSVLGATGLKYSLGNASVGTTSLDVMLIYLPRGKVLQSEGPFRGHSISLLMDLDWLRQTLGLHDPFIRFLGRNDEGLLLRAPRVTSVVPRLFAEMAAASTAPDLTRRLLFRAKALELLAVSLDLLAERELPNGSHHGPDPNEREIAEAAMRHIKANLRAEISADALARTLGTNRTTLRESFRRTTGRSMIQFRRECRMEVAEGLLRSQRLSVSDVAFEVGYADSPSFCIAYRQYFGRTPGEARHVAGSSESSAADQHPLTK